MKLPHNLKEKLAKTFGIPKSGYTHVSDGQVVTDGYTEQDLSVLTLEKLQEFVCEKLPEDTFESVFNKVIERLEKPEPTIQILEGRKAMTDEELLAVRVKNGFATKEEKVLFNVKKNIVVPMDKPVEKPKRGRKTKPIIL